MPSLFSRSRTTSTPTKKHSLSPQEYYGGPPTIDEFGRVSSRLSNRDADTQPNTSAKKDKKKDKNQEKQRNRTMSHKDRQDSDFGLESSSQFLPDGSFLPLNLERTRNEPDAPQLPKDHDYGFLSYERHVVLGLDEIVRLTEVIVDELGTRGGITTPFIFSTTALDISASSIKRIIRSFLQTCVPNGAKAGEAEGKWREEARFAGPHELAMCLRWGLARAVRSVGGQDFRGLIAWDHYLYFRDSEAALGYPPNHFETFLPELVTPLRKIMLAVLTLLTRLTANSSTSGHTPPTLSPLFGPLIFGLGPPTLAFHHTYIHYLRAANAMEHLLLSFIRWQDTPRINNPAANYAELNAYGSALGVPTRLKEWIKGYPSMLPFLAEKNEKPQARRGARTVRVMSVRRNVRMYSPDLVKTAATWAHRHKSSGTGPENALALSKEWDKIAPATLKLPPRYSEAYKKRMDMPTNFHPDNGPGTDNVGASGLRAAASNSSYSSTTTNGSITGGDAEYMGIGREGEDRFRSLTDLKWGEFESMGFGGLGEDNKKLQFDLTEGARSERSAKRSTLSWNDFSSAGFTRTDAPLSATLQFSAPVVNTVSTWPAHQAEMSKKLKKSQKSLPPFGWDTEPIVGNEEVIEEAFLDVFCDLVYGGGWMDLERGEQVDRDCNWALVEFKSLPSGRSSVSGVTDPRTSTTLILFEEFVPLEYRQQLAVTTSSRRRLPSLFSPSGKSKQWKQAATLNGRPYVVGHVPRSPSYREVEFEGLLRGGNATKVISLTGKNSVRSPPITTPGLGNVAGPSEGPSKSAQGSNTGSPFVSDSAAKSDELHSDSTLAKKSRFRLPGGIPVPSPGGNRKSGMVPSEYSTVEFETRLASYSDDEYTGQHEPESVKQKRRESKDDAWVDILVGTHNRRMGGQEAETKEERRRGLRGRRSDPDLASLEAAQVLAAAVRDRSFSPPSVVNDRVDRDYGMDHLHDLHDLDVDEVETVPRTSGLDNTSLADNDTLEYAPDELEPVEVEEESVNQVLTQRQAARQQRRLGYFDLHPERRPAASASEDDDQTRLAYDVDSEDDAEEDLYGSPEQALATAHAGHAEPITISLPEVQVSSSDGHEPVKEVKIPASLGHNGNHNGTIADPKPVTPSKTATLIEMYRERERGSSPSIPAAAAPNISLAPSRLPVRAGSTLKDAIIPPTMTALPVTVSPQPPSREPSPEVAAIEPPRVTVIEETGRGSPARYVHGAPLHNVLEEEEEEP